MHVARIFGVFALVVCGVAFAQEASEVGDFEARQEDSPTAGLEQQAALPDPTDDQPQSRCVLYHKRGLANLRLGRYQRAIADLKQAYALTQPAENSHAGMMGHQRRRFRSTTNPSAPPLPQSGSAAKGEWCHRWRVESHLAKAYEGIGDQFAAIELLQTAAPEWQKTHVRAYFYTQLELTGPYLALGMLKEADEAFDRAIAALPELKTRRDWETIQNNVNDVSSSIASRLQGLHGNYGEAEKLRRASLAYAQRYLEDREKLPNPVGVRIAKENVIRRTVALSRILSIQGKFGEAEYFAYEGLSQTLSMYAFGTVETSRALKTLASIKLQRGEIGDAAHYEEIALDALMATDMAPYAAELASQRATLGLIRNMQGRWDDAVHLFGLRKQGLASNSEQWKVLGGGHIEWAMALVKTGRADRAVEMLQRVLNSELKRPFYPPLRIAWAQAYLGVALAERGDDGEALTYFQRALPVLLRQTQDGVDDEDRGQVQLYRLRVIADSYLELLGRLHSSSKQGQDWVTEAFKIAEIARNSSVQQAVVVSAARAQLPDAGLAELARREQDDTSRIQALSTLLDNAVSGEQRSNQAIASLQQQIVSLRTQQESLRNEIAQRFPAYASLVRPRPVTPADVQRVLQPGEAMVSIYSGDRQSYVWTITPTSVGWRTVGLSRDQAGKVVAGLRDALDLEDGRLKAFDGAASYGLYASLLAPDAKMWANASVLIIVPHGALGALPFSVLLTAPTRPAAATDGAAYAAMPWLIDRVAIVQQSSASSLVAQRRVRSPDIARSPFIGFGDPLFAVRTEGGGPAGIHVRQLRVPATGDVLQPLVNQAQHSNRPVGLASRPDLPTLAQAFSLLPALPDTANELAEIARTLGASSQSDLYLGARASKANVKRIDLSRYRVIAFATHGLKAGELAGLDQPALALANPALTHESGDDGFLKLEDVFGLSLNADWVILSACNTASPDGSRSEAVSGLGRGFFYAGARSVLVSNWAVESKSARLLTTGLFREQQGHPGMVRSEALRRSMLDLKERHPGEYGHPAFWAPFSLAGEDR